MTLLRFLRERALDDGGEAWVDPRASLLEAKRLRLADGQEQLRNVVSLERRRAREHLVEADAGRPHVGPRIEATARTCSGAMYAGVPAWNAAARVETSGDRFHAMPKSRSFTKSKPAALGVRKTFAGLTSR